MYDNWRVVFLQNDPGFLNYLIRGLESQGIKGSSIQKDEAVPGYNLRQEFSRITERNIIVVRCNDALVPRTFVDSRNFIKTFNNRERRKSAYQKDVMMGIFKRMGIDSLAISQDEAIRILFRGEPIIIKATKHQGGDGIHFIASAEELLAIAEAYDFEVLYERFTPFQEEYRVIVFNKTYILIKKILQANAENVRDHANKISKGGFTGFGYKYIATLSGSDNTLYNQWYTKAKEISEEFDLEFCMVDIGVYQGQTHYIEVNSSVPMPGPFVDRDKQIIGNLFATEAKNIIDRFITERRLTQ